MYDIYLIEMIPQKFYYQALTIKNYVVLLHCLSKTPCRKNNKEKNQHETANKHSLKALCT